MRQVEINVKGVNVKTDDIHECRLLAVSPMPALLDTDDEGQEKFDKEAVSFNVEHHVNFLQESFEYYNKDSDRFIFCQCADSAAVNIKVAKITDIPHVSCRNQNLSLACDEMVEK